MKRERSDNPATYEVRGGSDGKMGIYLRAYNIRCAVFNANTESLQELLQKLFNGNDGTVTRR